MADNVTARERESQLRWILGEESEVWEGLRKEQWQQQPQIFIGLGSTGTQVVTRLAERLGEMIRETESGSAVLPSCLQFLAMDTNTLELSATVRAAGVEVIDLTVSNPDVVWSDNEEAFTAFGFEGPMSVELGAGGKRKTGLFAFLTHSNAIKEALKLALAEAQGAPELENRDPRIHVFLSLAGGTGSGAFLPFAFLLREMTESMQGGTELNAYIVVPDNIVAPVDSVTMASTAQSLADLEYFMQLGRGTFSGWGDAPRAGDEMVYWKRGRVKGRVRRPFDLCYLFGSAGARSEGTVREVSDFASVLAEAAIRNAFSKSGKQNRVSVVDVPINVHFDEEWRGRYASFSAIGYSRMVVPTDDVCAYLSLGLAENFADYLLDGPRAWDVNGAEAESLQQTYLRQLVTGLSIEQVVTPKYKPTLDLASAMSALEKLNSAGKNGEIKSACDALGNLFDTVWSAAEKLREATIADRVQRFAKIVDRHIADPTAGLRDDIAFFNALKAHMTVSRSEIEQRLQRAREDLDRHLAKIPGASQYLSKKGRLFDWILRDRAFNQLTGVYQLVIKSLREYILARSNSELASAILQEFETQIDRLIRVQGIVLNDLKARYASRRKVFQKRLRGWAHGRGRDDCKTFCPADLDKMVVEAENMLDPLRSKFPALVRSEDFGNKLDLKQLADGSADVEQKARLAVLDALMAQVNANELWQNLTTDAEKWEGLLRECRRTVLRASSPLLRFAGAPNAAVIGCYANFPSEALDRMQELPADVPKYRVANVEPLVPQSNCEEATRFFHGIRLRDLAIIPELSNHHRAYMEDLRRAATGGQAVENFISLFPSLTAWAPSDEPAPKSAEDELLRLWALGLCFAEIFPADKEQKTALDSANKVAKAVGQRRLKDRRNFLFSIGNYYYLQPHYETPVAQAPSYIQLGRSRSTAYEEFRSNGKAIAEMRKWYEHADQNWNEVYTTPELQDAVREYLGRLTSSTRDNLIIQEREIIRAFMETPFG